MQLLSTILSALLVLATSVSANPLPIPSAPPAQVCSAVVEVVDLLKLFKATPFCSSFLSIHPVTQTQTATTSQTSTTTATVITTTSPTISSTVVSTTVVSTVVVVTATSLTTTTATDVTATSTELSDITSITATSTVLTESTITDSVTDTVTLLTTTTVYTDPLRRRSVEAAADGKRPVSIPAFIQSYASSAISEACSCLDLPTPTSSTTVTTTVPVTASTATTSIVTSPVTAVTVTVVTLTSPSTASTTLISTVVSTFDTITETMTTSIFDTEVITTATSVSTTDVTGTVTSTAPPVLVTTVAPLQVVQNPSFETGSGSSSAPPWSGFFLGDPFSFLITECDSSLCAYDGTRFVDVEGDSPGGTTSITQTLVGVVPGKTYAFSCYVGNYNSGLPSLTIGTYVSVTLGGVIIVPDQITCSTTTACNAKGSSSYDWRQITATVVPTTTNPNLVVTFRLVIPSDQQIQDGLLDLVTLTLQD